MLFTPWSLTNLNCQVFEVSFFPNVLWLYTKKYHLVIHILIVNFAKPDSSLFLHPLLKEQVTAIFCITVAVKQRCQLVKCYLSVGWQWAMILSGIEKSPTLRRLNWEIERSWLSAWAESEELLGKRRWGCLWQTIWNWFLFIEDIRVSNCNLQESLKFLWFILYSFLKTECHLVLLFKISGIILFCKLSLFILHANHRSPSDPSCCSIFQVTSPAPRCTP